MPRGGTRQSRTYEMTRDGFTPLAMGFTGKTALAFKVRYIEEFNRMEAQLKMPQAPQLPNFMDPGEAATLSSPLRGRNHGWSPPR